MRRRVCVVALLLFLVVAGAQATRTHRLRRLSLRSTSGDSGASPASGSGDATGGKDSGSPSRETSGSVSQASGSESQEGSAAPSQSAGGSADSTDASAGSSGADDNAGAGAGGASVKYGEMTGPASGTDIPAQGSNEVVVTPTMSAGGIAGQEDPIIAGVQPLLKPINKFVKDVQASQGTLYDTAKEMAKPVIAKLKVLQRMSMRTMQRSNEHLLHKIAMRATRKLYDQMRKRQREEENYVKFGNAKDAAEEAKQAAKDEAEVGDLTKEIANVEAKVEEADA